MKNILHFQVPLNSNGEIAIRAKDLGTFISLTKNLLGEDYYVIASPCIPSLLSSESLLNFDMKQVNVEELIKLIQEIINW